MVDRAHDRVANGSADLLEVLQEITDSNTNRQRLRPRLGRWPLRHQGLLAGGLRL
ncbi:hypothetical protein PE066_18940 [Ramlibacter tataouinensis]|uniref:hypothetical protein n=1 Tax=Ramlibacter tataouinensis TaxID=94132 RepID=UPI0022F37F1C|nr:hypothetical protein [Ramlibacter tataouinensis]WBY01516.1 hypothetical protein PE066_18940 [Ramlibacter tataouinensis]